MKRIAQFRFHYTGSSANYPYGLTAEDWSGNLLQNCGLVSHLGIQGEPGVVFYLNDGDNPIVLGSTGIYELNLEGIGRIASLRFDKDSLEQYYTKEVNDDAHRLLVDIIYDGAEV